MASRLANLENRERDATLASVAKDAIQYGAYRTALDNADQITDAVLRDETLLALVRDALARGLYTPALETAEGARTPRIRNQALREIAEQARRYGHLDQASRAARLMAAPAPRTVAAAQGKEEAVVPPHNTAVSAAFTDAPRRSLPFVLGACGLTAALWGVGVALHGNNLHEWLTTQIDNLGVTAFLMATSSLGSAAYDWWSRRQ